MAEERLNEKHKRNIEHLKVLNLGQ
jgi:hypothetical protein